MDDEKDRTLWVGGLASEVTEELLYELFLQAGPLHKLIIPKDKESGRQKSFAFVTFKHVESVQYAKQVLAGISLYRSYLKLQTRPGSIHDQNQPGDNFRQDGQMNQFSPQMNPNFQRSHTWHGDANSQAWNMQRGQPVSFSMHGQNGPALMVTIKNDDREDSRSRSKDRPGQSYDQGSRGHSHGRDYSHGRDNSDRDHSRGRDQSSGYNQHDNRWIDHQQPKSQEQSNESRRNRVVQQHTRVLDQHRGGYKDTGSRDNYHNDRHSGRRY